MMYINLNPGTVGLSGRSFESLLAGTAAHGFGGIDLPMDQAETPEAARDLRGRIEDAGLRPGLIGLPCDFLCCSDEEFDAGMARLEAMRPRIEAAAPLRAYNHIWPGHDERDYEQNWAVHVARLRRLVPVLRDAGVSYGVEFIGPLTMQTPCRYPFLRTVTETARLCDEVEGLGLIIDLFHFHCSGGTLDELRDAAGRHPVVNVHANDAIAGRPRDEQIDHERAMPLETGVIDAAGVLGVLNEVGYDGPVIAEPFEPNRSRLAEMETEAALAEVGACMLRLFDEVERA